MDITLLCRSCMNEMALSERENFDPSAVPKFTFCTNIEVTDDGLPTQFCQDCIVKIKSSYYYIKKAQEVNIALKNLYSTKYYNRVIIESDQVTEGNDNTTDIKLDSDIKNEDSLFLDNTDTSIEIDQLTEVNDKTTNDDLKLDSDIKKEDSLFLDNTDTSIEIDQLTEVNDKTTNDDLKLDSDIKKEDSLFLDNTDTSIETDQRTEVDDKSTIDHNFHSDVKNGFTNRPFLETDTSNDSDCPPSDIKIVKNAKALTNKRSNVTEQHQNKTQSVNVFKVEKSLRSKSLRIVAHPNKNIKDKVTLNEDDKNAQNKNRTHETTSEMCPICCKIFIHEKSLQRHINSRHPKKEVEGNKMKNAPEYEIKHIKGKEIIQCSMCDRSFMSKAWFTRHIEREHSKNVTVRACSHCPKSFRTTQQLLYHVDSAHPEHRQHACSACGKRFRRRKYLVAHAVVHSTTRPHSCTKCDMMFKSTGSLTKHMKVHKGERPHLCHICGDRFPIAGNLQVHVLTHTGAKPYACEQCSYRATTRAHLQRHARSHSKERSRPDVCGQCGKAFSDRFGLTRHMRSHTGDRPYKCPFCASAFADSWKRRVHMLRAHALARGDVPRLRRDGQVDTGCARGAAKANVT